MQLLHYNERALNRRSSTPGSRARAEARASVTLDPSLLSKNGLNQGVLKGDLIGNTAACGCPRAGNGKAIGSRGVTLRL